MCAKSSTRILRRAEVKNPDPAGDPNRRAPAEQNDPVEIWGKRIGRVLSVLLFIGLVFWLVMG
jgi:hypothetical protein